MDTRASILERFTFVTLGKTELLAMVAKSDSDLARKIKWTVAKRFDGKPIARERGGKGRYLHLLVAERHHGPRPSANHVCEHLNGDLLDCRPENLKWSLRGQTTFYRQRSAAGKLQSGSVGRVEQEQA